MRRWAACGRVLLTASRQQETAVRRADRLFQIIQILRRGARPVTASALAEELEVSKRSVYRDIADLIGQRVPIQGEAGLGYVLDSNFDMPPLMLTPDEIEAAVLGAQWVAERGDPVLAHAARDLIAKIAKAVPERLRPFIAEPTIGAPPGNGLALDGPGYCEDPFMDPQRAQDTDPLSRPGDARQRAHHLAGDHRLCRDSASVAGLVRAASGVSAFQDRSHRRRRIS
jgi:hypothetical protein